MLCSKQRHKLFSIEPRSRYDNAWTSQANYTLLVRANDLQRTEQQRARRAGGSKAAELRIQDGVCTLENGRLLTIATPSPPSPPSPPSSSSELVHAMQFQRILVALSFLFTHTTALDHSFSTSNLNILQPRRGGGHGGGGGGGHSSGGDSSSSGSGSGSSGATTNGDSDTTSSNSGNSVLTSNCVTKVGVGWAPCFDSYYNRGIGEVCCSGNYMSFCRRHKEPAHLACFSRGGPC